MPAETVPASSARRDELLEKAYRYVLEHGLADMSLRPLAAAVQSSPRVLLFLFESKDALVRALLARARADEVELLEPTRCAAVGRSDSSCRRDLGLAGRRRAPGSAAAVAGELLALAGGAGRSVVGIRRRHRA